MKIGKENLCVTYCWKRVQLLFTYNHVKMKSDATLGSPMHYRTSDTLYVMHFPLEAFESILYISKHHGANYMKSYSFIKLYILSLRQMCSYKLKLHFIKAHNFLMYGSCARSWWNLWLVKPWDPQIIFTSTAYILIPMAGIRINFSWLVVLPYVRVWKQLIS